MLERLSTAVEFWLVLESRHGGTELLCPVESAFQGCGSQSFVISVLGGGKWRHDPWLGCDVSYLCLEVSTGRTDHGLAQSNSFWAGYGRAQLINGSTGQKTNWSLEPSRSKCVDEVRSVSVLVLMVGVSSRFQRIKGWRKQSKLGESEQGCGEHMIRGVGEDIAMASKMVKKIWRKLKSQSERRRR
ncbi:hypothetical protein F2Q68_00004278 [Brassica cretica]|uniref:Uncharacterized protein n=1 Tax=Brassica cretica TaxID=69181 RepID=A0A8S9JL66_BRACR|nr:hypothetical protein F2Q68_00004278 [Brassica cretica]